LLPPDTGSGLNDGAFGGLCVGVDICGIAGNDDDVSGSSSDIADPRRSETTNMSPDPSTFNTLERSPRNPVTLTFPDQPEKGKATT
jgi:hypothetical protein